MDFTLGQITLYTGNNDASPTQSPPAAPAVPAPPAAPKHSGRSSVVIGKDGSVVIDDDGESIQAAPPRHGSSRSDGGGGDTVAIVFIVFVFGYLIVKVIVNAFTRNGGKGQRLSAEEQAVVAKLQRTLAQMESRVESLETILVESRRSKESYGTKF